jgi:hypothetical protein
VASLEEPYEESSDEFSSVVEEESSETEDEDDVEAGMSGATPPVPRVGHVPQNIKRQIQKGEYIKLSLLEPKDPAETRPPRFTFDPESGQFEQILEKKKFSFTQWRRCYITYMSIRVKAFPKETQGLLRHLEIVEELQSQGLDGMTYDRKFRETKAQHPNIPWGTYLADLVIGSLSVTRALLPHRTTSLAAHPQPSRPCRAYNSPGGCNFPQCRFSHVCARCHRSGHAALRCFARSLFQALPPTGR